MDAERWRQVNELLPQALELPEAERVAFLRSAEAEEEVLEEVRSLLGVDLGVLDGLEGLRPRLAALPGDEVKEPERWGQGSSLGPYRIVRELGRGGMGIVYLAERADGEFKRQVALKVLKRGMDTDDIVRRFRNERQILAQLRHSNIAGLYDGGTTEDHRPYFVMEFVEGEPIDQFCDRKRMPVRDRLELFLKVCGAVQVAHQSLVVHRDLKPSNILVQADGEPKLLDFGIAKLLSPIAGMDETRTGRLRPMTPAYASPEQVGGGPITTASDVYSLGVLLFVLLTGRRPFKASVEKGADLEKVITEREAVRPSSVVLKAPETRRSNPRASRQTPEQASFARRTDPRRLRRLLSGDLDNILLQALRREPDRRYPTVGAFTEDLRRYLEGRPVSARRETLFYRASKFAQRHFRELLAAALLSLLLVVFGIDRALQQKRVDQVTQRADFLADEMQGVSQLVDGLFELEELVGAGGDPNVLRQLLDRGRDKIDEQLAERPGMQSELRLKLSKSYLRLGLYGDASDMAEKAVEQRRNHFGGSSLEVAEALLQWSSAEGAQGRYADAEKYIQQALEIQRRHFPDDDPQILNTQAILASSMMDRGLYEEVEPIFQDLLERERQRLGEEDALVTGLMGTLGEVLHQLGRDLEAEKLLRRALEITRQRPQEPGMYPHLYSHVVNLGAVLKALGRYEEAEERYREALELATQMHGERHPVVANAQNNLGMLLVEMWDLEGARDLLDKSLTTWTRELGGDHPLVAIATHNQAWLLWLSGDPVAAEPMARRALALKRQGFGEEHPRVRTALRTLAGILVDQGQAEAAEPMAREAWRRCREELASTAWHTALASDVLGRALAEMGRYEEAEARLLEARQIFQQKWGPENLWSKRVHQHLLELYGVWGRPERIEALRDSDRAEL